MLAPMGLRLSEEKTTIVHIDEGFDFLGFRIQRHRKRGTNKRFVYTYPSKKALASEVKAKVKTISRQGRTNRSSDLLRQLNPVLRGWTNYFRHGVSKATFGYLRQFTWRRVVGWLRRKHRRPTGSGSDGATSPGGGRPRATATLFDPERRGHPLPLPGTDPRTPWAPTDRRTARTTRARGEPDAVEVARPVRRAGRGNGPAERPTPRPGPTSTTGRPRSCSTPVCPCQPWPRGSATQTVRQR